MKRIKRNHALTLLEALIVVLIIGMLAAMLYPVFESLKMKMKVVGTVQRMKQFHIALQMYRQDWGGADVFTSFRSYYTVGLPPNIRETGIPEYVWMPVDPMLPGIRPEDWIGPCSPGPMQIPESFDEGIRYGGVSGHMRLVAHMYDPLVMLKPVEGGGFTWNWYMYHDYLQRYRENAVILAEFYCNLYVHNPASPLMKKRGIALLLSGQVVTKYDVGDWGDLRWFSRPPD